MLYKPNNSKNSPFMLSCLESQRDSNYGPWPDRPLRFTWLKGDSQKALRCVSIERNIEMCTVPKEGTSSLSHASYRSIHIPFIFQYIYPKFGDVTGN